MKNVIEKLSSRQKAGIGIAVIALASLATGYGLAQLGEDTGGAENTSLAAGSGCNEVLYWYDPMVPAQRFDEPGKSPFMDMELVPKCASEAASAAVQIDPGLVQNFGIRTAQATMGTLDAEITVTGVLAYNARDVVRVQPRTGGYVERTYGRAPDDVVARGAPLADILVPEWGGAQQEFLAVLDTGDKVLEAAMRERMRLLGMPAGLISSVAHTRRPQPIITVRAPASGAITSLEVRSGMTVMAGQTLAEISGFSPIWLEAAVPETQAASVRVGMPISASLTAFPGERVAGRIIAVLPSAEDTSRTITVRAQLPNPRGRLKPGMFAEVLLTPDIKERLLIPSEAVIQTGRRSIVMLAREEGGYLPAEIRIGREAGGRTEILAGLASGEKVVTSGQFLLDSEASLSGLDVRAIEDARKSSDDRRDRTPENATSKTYSATGTVEKIDRRSVTLRHGPVPELDWPAMTMSFGVENPAQLRSLESGERVEFVFAQEGTGPRIVSIREVSQ